MIDFLKQQNIIQEYIDEIYTIRNFKIVTDYLDFDKYKNDFIINIEFDTINFPFSKLNDDCTKLQNLLVNIYLVHRNNTPSELNKKMLEAASHFHSLIMNMKSDDIFFDVNINNINFFKYIEGSTNIMASKFELQINIEI